MSQHHQNVKRAFEITCALLGDGKVERVGAYYQVKSAALDVRVSVITRTIGTDTENPRMIAEIGPEHVSSADLHALYTMNNSGQVVDALACSPLDYYLLLLSHPHFKKKTQRLQGRPRIDELKMIPGFIDLTAEARAVA